jgi:enoyl-CoA hydratase/carnithine racemase
LADERVRVVVLRGTQECFCLGMDLDEIQLEQGESALQTGTSPAKTSPAKTSSAASWEDATRDFTAVLQTILEARPITVALVEGPTRGGGTGLSSACDLVLATDEASFGLPELVLGLVPAMILPVLAERLGLHQAKRWAITQATWKAGEANTKGLVDQLVPEDRVESTLKRTLRTLTRLHPRGVIALKHHARLLSAVDVVAAMAEGRDLLVDMLRRPDVRADVIAFRDYGILPGQSDS